MAAEQLLLVPVPLKCTHLLGEHRMSRTHKSTKWLLYADVYAHLFHALLLMIWLTTCSACHLPCTVKYRNEEGTHKRKRIEGYRKYVRCKEDRKSFSINQSSNQVVMFNSSDLRISVYAIDTSS
jgi:hypothetical protein